MKYSRLAVSIPQHIPVQNFGNGNSGMVGESYRAFQAEGDVTCCSSVQNKKNVFSEIQGMYTHSSKPKKYHFEPVNEDSVDTKALSANSFGFRCQY